MRADDLPRAFAHAPDAWRAVLPEWDAALEQRISDAVRRVSGSAPMAPTDPFRALRLVSPEQVRVVILGQDPYPGAGHADGLAFSAPTSSRPSLRRIFDILEADRPGWRRPRSGRLDAWATQGALLLNPTLTVEVGKINSHGRVGWQLLTGAIVRWLAQRPQAPAFLLWGSHAQRFFDASLAGAPPVAAPVLTTRHPSNDFHRRFMAEGSHFQATADRIDWWVLTDS